MFKKQKTFIIIIASILLFLIVMIGWLSFDVISPSTPSPFVAPTAAPPPEQKTILFNKNAEKTLLDKLVKRRIISSNDQHVKASLIALTPADTRSGVIYSSNSFSVEYLGPLDEFKVQITTTDIDRAKADAVTWFKSQGMSLQGICDLPVNFYLNTTSARYLQEKQIPFSVLPNECL